MSADTLRSLGSGLRINLSANSNQVSAANPPRICAATGKACGKACASPGPCKDWTFARG